MILAACPKFKFLYNIATVFKAIHFLGRKQHNSDQEKMCCISQGSVVTFLRCGGQTKNHLCQIYSGFCEPKLLKSIHFWLSYLRNIIHVGWRFLKHRVVSLTRNYTEIGLSRRMTTVNNERSTLAFVHTTNPSAQSCTMAKGISKDAFANFNKWNAIHKNQFWSFQNLNAGKHDLTGV